MDKKIAPQHNTYEHVYHLEGQFKGTRPQDIFQRLTKDLQATQHKIESTDTGGFIIKTSSPIYRESITLHDMKLVLIGGEKDTNKKETIIFHKKDVTVSDFLEAGVCGVYRVRKWPPNKKTGVPNNGYSVYFYDESWAAYAAMKSPYLIKGTQTYLRPATPFEISTQGELARNQYRTKRAEDLIALAATLDAEQKFTSSKPMI